MSKLLAGGAITPGQDDEWQALISRLSDHLDELTADFIERFGSLDHYGPGAVSASDLHNAARATMKMLLLRLAGHPLPHDLMTLPQDLGARRARQGVPRDLLLEAVRLDFRVLWSHLQRLGGPDSDALLVRNLERVLTTVDTYVSEVQQSFLAEEARLRRDSGMLRARYVSRLFSSDLTHPDVLSEIGNGLGVQTTAVFQVVVVVSEGTAKAQELQVRGELKGTWLGYDRGAGYCLFRQQPRHRALPESLANLPGGHIDDVNGLDGVPAAADAATLLARHGGFLEGKMNSMEQAWTGVAQMLLEENLPGFTRRVWVPLEACTSHERERILQTVIEYGRTGSIKEVAVNLFCHRNTVVNRLRSFRELTGLDMTVPIQGAMALCALGNQAEHVTKTFRA